MASLRFLRDVPPYTAGERGGGRIPVHIQADLVRRGLAEWSGPPPGEIPAAPPRPDPTAQPGYDPGGPVTPTEIAGALEAGFQRRAEEGVSKPKRRGRPRRER